MSKMLLKIIGFAFNNPGSIRVRHLINSNTQAGQIPLLMILSSGSTLYFKFSVMGLGIGYINMLPLFLSPFIVSLEQVNMVQYS